jgi:hypothetical protein
MSSKHEVPAWVARSRKISFRPQNLVGSKRRNVTRKHPHRWGPLSGLRALAEPDDRECGDEHEFGSRRHQRSSPARRPVMKGRSLSQMHRDDRRLTAMLLLSRGGPSQLWRRLAHPRRIAGHERETPADRQRERYRIDRSID